MPGNKEDPHKEKTDAFFHNQIHYKEGKFPTILLEANKQKQKDIHVGFPFILGISMKWQVPHIHPGV